VNELFDVHNDDDAKSQHKWATTSSSIAVASETSRQQANEQQGVMENIGSIWNIISGLNLSATSDNATGTAMTVDSASNSSIFICFLPFSLMHLLMLLGLLLLLKSRCHLHLLEYTKNISSILGWG